MLSLFFLFPTPQNNEFIVNKGSYLSCFIYIFKSHVTVMITVLYTKGIFLELYRLFFYENIPEYSLLNLICILFYNFYLFINFETWFSYIHHAIVKMSTEIL